MKSSFIAIILFSFSMSILGFLALRGCDDNTPLPTVPDTLIVLDSNTVQLLTSQLQTEKQLRQLAEIAFSDIKDKLRGKDRALIEAELQIRNLELQLDSQYVRDIDSSMQRLTFDTVRYLGKDYTVLVQNNLFAPLPVFSYKDSLRIISNIGFQCDPIVIKLLLSELPDNTWSTIIDVNHSLFQQFGNISTTIAKRKPLLEERLRLGTSVGLYNGAFVGVDGYFDHVGLGVILGNNGLGFQGHYSLTLQDLRRLLK